MSNPARYKLVRGRGDSTQEDSLNQAAEGYKATLMAFDPEGRKNNEQLIVLMEHANHEPSRLGTRYQVLGTRYYLPTAFFFSSAA